MSWRNTRKTVTEWAMGMKCVVNKIADNLEAEHKKSKKREHGIKTIDRISFLCMQSRQQTFHRG